MIPLRALVVLKLLAVPVKLAGTDGHPSSWRVPAGTRQVGGYPLVPVNFVLSLHIYVYIYIYIYFRTIETL